MHFPIFQYFEFYEPQTSNDIFLKNIFWQGKICWQLRSQHNLINPLMNQTGNFLLLDVYISFPTQRKYIKLLE